MVSINTNLSSLIAQNSLKSSTNKLNTAVERMSTGYKINHAKDNAANYSISTNMTTKIGAYMVAEDNALQGLDMINTASESLSLIEDKLMRLRALATQANNGTYGTESKDAINAEANALVDEIERLYNTTEYNGINLAKGRVVGTEESKFIKNIDRRDTSKMRTLASVAIDETLTSGTYSISTADELAKLATMTNNGLIGANTEFVLANDIDLSGYSNWTPIGTSKVNGNGDILEAFVAKFDGNGYTISNLKINSNNDVNCGLFGHAKQATIENLGLDRVNISTTASCVGSLVGFGTAIIVDNCYVENASLKSTSSYSDIGGLFGFINGIKVSDSYSLADIEGKSYIGGFAGVFYNGVIKRCFSEGDVSATGSDIGGFLGGAMLTIDISESYSNSSVTKSASSLRVGALIGSSLSYTDTTFDIESCAASYSQNLDGIFVGDPLYCSVKINNSHYDERFNSDGISIAGPALADKLAQSNIATFASGSIPIKITNNATVVTSTSFLQLQTGINGTTSSQIGIDAGYLLGSFSSLREIGTGNSDYLSEIDKMLATVSEKQTEYGAVQNRLESALDEISTQYENLVSSRSTIRDADLAEESASYIQQQILQQASATLLSTANQSPSIALQLI